MRTYVALANVIIGTEGQLCTFSFLLPHIIQNRRDVQRTLASAAAMNGDDVEDSLIAPKREAEEVPSRLKIKMLTKASVKQAVRSFS